MTEWNMNNLSFSYGSLQVFKNFFLSFSEARSTAILGPSGCGKTSLLHLLAGLVFPDAGSIHCSNKASVSFVFQEARLLPWRSVLDNVAIPLEKEYGKTAARDRAEHYLALVGLKDKLISFPEALSGGQRQRVSIARAFAFPSHTILMDEPLQSLDLPLRIQLMDVILALLADEPRLLISVTHDPREAIYLADRILVMSHPPVSLIMDVTPGLSRSDRQYSSKAPAELEARLFEALQH